VTATLAARPVSRAVLRLSWLTGILAAVAAGTGLFWSGTGGPLAAGTVRSQPVELYGHGLYRYDTLFAAGGQRGTDAVILAVGLPLLVATARWYRRGSPRGALLLTGTLGFFLYCYASLALGTVAFNPMFPVYVAVFSVTLFGFVLLLVSFDRDGLAGRMPRHGPAVFMAVSALVTLLVWGLPVVAALVGGTAPARLDTYSTLVTVTLDVGIIVPAAATTAVLLWRRRPWGDVLAVALLVPEVLLALMIAAQTVGQVAAGVVFTPGEVIGPIVGFVVISVAAAWFLAAILRQVPVAAELVPNGTVASVASPLPEGDRSLHRWR
jgi:hypothetical protein